MKCIVLFSLATASLNLYASRPGLSPTAIPAYIRTQSAIAATPLAALPKPEINAHDTKQQGESPTRTSSAITTPMQQSKGTLSISVHKKIAQLYPKWPINAFPYLISHEVEIQQKLVPEKSKQEITLDIDTQFALEVAYECVPLLNSVMSQLEKKHLPLKDEDIKSLWEPTVLLIKQKINTLNQKFYKTDRPAQFDIEDFKGVYYTYETIKALPNHSDKLLLLEQTLPAVVIEIKPVAVQTAPAPTKAKAKPPAKKDICVIC